jgi:hypothetical protein
LHCNDASLSSPRGTGSAEADIAGSGDGDGAVADLELENDCGDVVADRLVGQAEAAGNGMVAATGGDQIEHVIYARGEFREGVGGVGASSAGEEADDASGDGGAVDGTSGDGEDGANDFAQSAP